MAFEYRLSAKWLELLKQIGPGGKRAPVLWDPAMAAGIGQFAFIQSVAPSLGLEVNDWLIQDELAKLVLASSGVQSTAPTEVPTPHARARAQSIPARWPEAVVAADGERHRNG